MQKTNRYVRDIHLKPGDSPQAYFDIMAVGDSVSPSDHQKWKSIKSKKRMIIKPRAKRALSTTVTSLLASLEGNTTFPLAGIFLVYRTKRLSDYSFVNAYMFV